MRNVVMPMPTVQWKWERVNYDGSMNNVVNLQTFPFREVEGLQVRIKDNPTVIDFVELYLTAELFELLFTEANW